MHNIAAGFGDWLYGLTVKTVSLGRTYVVCTTCEYDRSMRGHSYHGSITELIGTIQMERIGLLRRDAEGLGPAQRVG
jgi:hypothetical protein